MKLIYILIGVLLLIPFVSAAEITSNSTVLGEQAPIWSFITNTSFSIIDSARRMTPFLPIDPLSKATLSAIMSLVTVDVQKTNANNQDITQVANDEELHNAQVNSILYIANSAWALTLGLFVVIYHLLLLLIVWFEMRLIIYILIELIPKSMLAISDMIVRAVSIK